MPRTRSIHPGQATDEDVATMSIWARYVWALLPCHADRDGRLKDSAFTLKAAILPGDAVEMEPILAELASRGHIVRYQVEGKKYIQIRTFSKYQTPHTRENASTIPPMSGVSGAGHDLGGASAQPRLASASPVPSSPDPDPDPGPDQIQSGSGAACARDPDAGTTDTEGVPIADVGPADPLTLSGLIAVVTGAVRRNRTEIGVYNPGRWSTRAAKAFLDAIPPGDRNDATRAEIRARAERFANSTDHRITDGTWAVDAFCENFARLTAQSAPTPVRPMSSAETAARRLAEPVIARYGT